MKPRVGVEWLAKRANVSIGTVDRALHGRAGIDDKTRARIVRIARTHDYRPNLAARALARNRTRIRIGVCIPPKVQPFHCQLWNGVYESAKRYRDYGIDFVFRPLLGPETLKRVLDCRVQGIIVAPNDSAKIAAMIDAAEEKGVRVLCLSSDAPDSKRSGVVCVEPRLNGLLAGEVMGKSVAAKSKVAVITERRQTANLLRNTEGFVDSFRRHCTGGEVVEVLEMHEDPAKGFRQTSALLARLSELSGVYANVQSCLSVCKAVEVRDKPSVLKLITMDPSEEMVPYFEKLTICASIYQMPYQQGRAAVGILIEHLSNNAALNSNYFSPSIVLKSSVRLFRKTGGNDAVEYDGDYLHDLYN